MSDQLKVESRKNHGKRSNRRLRRDGHLPAVLYGHGEECLSLTLAADQLEASLRHGAKVVRIEDGEVGLAARTIKRRLATIAGLYEYLLIRGDSGVARNPVPRGLTVRRVSQRRVPLIRAPRC